MHWKITQNEHELRITLNGHLDFDASHAIGHLLAQLQQRPNKDVCVDLQHVKDLDSSGLGLLLRLRSSLQAKEMAIRISGCNETHKNTLRTANFQRLFRIDGL